MDKKLKAAGISDIVLAAATFAFIAATLIFWYTGGLSEDKSADLAEALGSVVVAIIFIPLTFFSFAGAAGFSVFWIVCGVKYFGYCNNGKNSVKLCVADLVIKIAAIVLYVFMAVVNSALNLLFGILAYILTAILIASLVVQTVLCFACKNNKGAVVNE